MPTVLLLLASNVFMTVAWYWHLVSKSFPLWQIILISWFIALPEYCLAVTANRLGHIEHGGRFTAPQLKILTEGIALTVFVVFSITYLKETPRWNDFVALALIIAGLAVALLGKTG